MSLAIDASELNFSWVLEGKLAGCAGPVLPAHLEFLASQGVRALMRLAGRNEGVFDHKEIERFGIEDFHEPVSDYTTPEIDQVERAILFIDRCLEEGKPVAVSCGAGCGRTGTILSCYFVHLGLSAESAISKVRALGRCAFETDSQHETIRQFEQRKHGSGPLPNA